MFFSDKKRDSSACGCLCSHFKCQYEHRWARDQDFERKNSLITKGRYNELFLKEHKISLAVRNVRNMKRVNVDKNGVLVRINM